MGDKDFEDIVKFQEAIYESIRHVEQPAPSDDKRNNLKVVFDFMNASFARLGDSELQTGQGEEHITMNIDMYLCDLINQHKEDKCNLRTVLQIVYKIVQTQKESSGVRPQLKLGDAPFEKLIDLLLLGSQSTLLNANMLACLQLYASQRMSSNLIMRLWSGIVEHIDSQQHVQILIQLFDEFALHVQDLHKNPHLIAIIQRLLLSKERDQRKAGGFLLKKIVALLMDKVNSNVGEWGSDISDELQQRWTAYIALMDNLEENQSHLILPSLEALNSVEYRKASWKTWVDILYRRILAHNNVLVIRWALEHVLKTFTCEQLNVEILRQFLEAANNTSFYNGEGYWLPEQHISEFLNCKLDSLLELMGQINWKSVPLHFWLGQLHAHAQSTVSRFDRIEILQSIASRVRALQNYKIRKITIKLLEDIFTTIIDGMSLNEYLIFIETLYNVADGFNSHSRYLKKIEQYGDSSDVICSQRLYEIMINCLYLSLDQESLLSALKSIPEKKHGYLSLLVVCHFSHTEESIEFCRSIYDININALKKLALSELINHLRDKLNAEEVFAREEAVIFYIHNCLSTHDEADICSTMKEMLDIDSTRVSWALFRFLMSYRNPLKITAWKLLFPALRKHKLMKYEWEEQLYEDIAEFIDHCKKSSTSTTADSIHDFLEELLNIDLENVNICSAVLDSEVPLSVETYTRGMLFGDAKAGDARIELCYQTKLCKELSNYFELRSSYLCNIPSDRAQAVCEKLLQHNAELSRKKPRYFENSTEHRLKLRIAYALAYQSQRFEHLPVSVDDLWTALLEQNNQLNVSYLLEYVIAIQTNELNIMAKLKRLPNCTPSQQISIICVAHGFCIRNKKVIQSVVELTRIVNAILPLTMGANFQTRLYSQLVILSLLQKFRKIISMQEVENAIQVALGKQSVELLEDVRLTLHTINTPRVILYITNSPFDEFESSYDYSKYDSTRALFSKKISNYAKTSIEPEMQVPTATNLDTSNVQRKMNPVSDVFVNHDFTTKPNNKENELYVVASLVDKLPNLGGIARTCEVLGIKNLVVQNKAIVDKSDFKHLSMTAENGLNILEVKVSGLTEFLMKKQLEGFKVVGAEQTAESVSFADFEFPQKCILLLGHEKEGIPANLLGFLDYAVEIPQFGIVRSLNVHVTGALFMWEYCKQHIVGSN